LIPTFLNQGIQAESLRTGRCFALQALTCLIFHPIPALLTIAIEVNAMAFFDSASNLQAGQQQSSNQLSSAQPQPSGSIQNLSPEVKAQAVEAARPAAALMDQATSHRTEMPDASSSHTGGKEALMHTAGAPGKSQAALSPTDNHKGQTQTQQRSQERGRGMER
jgi:hypothetical protein